MHDTTEYIDFISFDLEDVRPYLHPAHHRMQILDVLQSWCAYKREKCAKAKLVVGGDTALRTGADSDLWHEVFGHFDISAFVPPVREKVLAVYGESLLRTRMNNNE